MAAVVKIPKILQDRTNGTARVAVQGDTVYECLADLIRRYPGLEGSILGPDGRILLQWMVYINDVMASRSDEASVQLQEGDTIALLPLVAGG
jgi:molybdopterin converting factor small subunit